MIIKKYLEKEKEGKQQCQNCLEFGHWTYECTRPQTYVYRPSRTKLFKQNKFNLFNIKDQKREESPKKEDKEKEKIKEKRSRSESSNSSSSSKSFSSSSNKNYKYGKKSYSSRSGSKSPNSNGYSSNSNYSDSSSFSRSDSNNSINSDEIILNKKREKLNEMLDNIEKYGKEKDKNNKSRSRSRSRHHHKREHHRRRRSRNRSRSRSDSRRRERQRKNEELNRNNNRNTFYGEYKLKRGERWKKIAELEQEERSNSSGRDRNGAFRRRPYQ